MAALGVVAVAAHRRFVGAVGLAEAFGDAGTVVVTVEVGEEVGAAAGALFILNAVAVVVLAVAADFEHAGVHRRIVVVAVRARVRTDRRLTDNGQCAVAEVVAVVVTGLVGLAVAVVVFAVANVGH